MAHTRRIRFPGDPPLEPPKIEEPSLSFGAEVATAMTAAIGANANAVQNAVARSVRATYSPATVLIEQLDFTRYVEEIVIGCTRSGFRKDRDGNLWFDSNDPPADAANAVASITYAITLRLIGVPPDCESTLISILNAGRSVPLFIREGRSEQALRGYAYLTSLVRTADTGNLARLLIELKMTLYTPL